MYDGRDEGRGADVLSRLAFFLNRDSKIRLGLALRGALSGYVSQSYARLSQTVSKYLVRSGRIRTTITEHSSGTST